MEDEQKTGVGEARISAAPKIRQVYWCDFWVDARLPEMWKTRLSSSFSYKNTLYGPCLVVPTSTDPQEGNPWAHRFSCDLRRVQSWAVCNQPATVSPVDFLHSKTGFRCFRSGFQCCLEIAVPMACRNRFQFLIESLALLDYIQPTRGPSNGCPLPAREMLDQGEPFMDSPLVFLSLAACPRRNDAAGATCCIATKKSRSLGRWIT